MQTGETSSSLATKATEQAALAHAAYMTAKTASEAAEAATDVTAAVRAQVDAENALADAMDAETMADEYGQMAMDAVGNELVIVGKDKNVGGTSLNADDGASNVTTDGVSVITGLMKTMNPMTTGAGTTGFDAMADTSNADDPDNSVAYVQAVAARTFEIGRTLDTSDDKARLMLVTHYAGSKMVNVYNAAEDPLGVMGSKAGYLTIDDGVANNGAAENGDDLNNVALKSEGMYYPAGAPNGGVTGALNGADDTVADDAEPKEVFSYVDPTDDTETRKYAVLRGENKTDAGTVYTYTDVDILVDHDAATGEMATADIAVKARLPEATEYKHIHFGVWAALGEAEKSGSQELSDLGIGFVQNWSGEGLTSIGGG